MSDAAPPFPEDLDPLTDGASRSLTGAAGPRRLVGVGGELILEWLRPGDHGPRTELQSLKKIRQRLAAEPSLAPACFIFHCGRCGSTLLARLLELDRGNRVHLEPRVLSQFLALHAGQLDRPEVIEAFRTLVGAFGLAPQSGEQRLVFKFNSRLVRHVAFIRTAFPTVDFVYLYRDPAEVVASTVRQLPDFLGAANRVALAAQFGDAPAGAIADRSVAEWCSWYVDRNLRHAWQHAELFSRAIDYRDFAAQYLAVFNTLASAPRTSTDPAIAAVLAAHSKQHRLKFSPEADAQKMTPAIRAIADRLAGDAYAQWRQRGG